VLYRVIDEHLEAFLETARRHADGAPLPGFVEQEFRDFLGCGVLAHGFSRLRCTDCALERLVPFWCKGRGFCPSCGGRPVSGGRLAVAARIQAGSGGSENGRSVNRAFVPSALRHFFTGA